MTKNNKVIEERFQERIAKEKNSTDSIQSTLDDQLVPAATKVSDTDIVAIGERLYNPEDYYSAVERGARD